ncbi:MAG TPA: ABC transporter substrate-binding protein [Paraburkholderia sp.]|nr:ABC transporter substrate-binding protein [Paraburkholderia sp.]
MASGFVNPGRRRCLNTLGALGLSSAWSAAALAGGFASPATAAASEFVANKAPRVVSLSWAGAQILVSLGIVPLGIAERADYPLSGAVPAMPASVLELGLHSEPNLELLQQIKPDLIVIDANQSDLDARLRSIAPTVTIDIYNAARGKPFARAVAETQRIGALLGRDAAVHRHLDEVDAQLAACAATVSTLAVPPVLIVDLYDDGRHLYLYGPNSMMQDVMDRLGVRNAWTGSTDTGYLLLGIEGLAAMGEAQMFYISHGVRDQIALHNLSRSVLWQHLPFVQAQRFKPLPGFFAYGSTPCAVQFASELTRQLAALDGQTHQAQQTGRARG